MANFYRDNDDIQFLFRHIDLGKLASVCEEDFKFAGQFDYAPADADEAVANYDMVLDSLGQLSADFIAPRAEDVDRQGNTLNQDGSVTYAEGIFASLQKLAQAEVMGFILPYRFGGLNFPQTVYSMAIEMVSRADASLMNIFGLQGIAETVNAFASEEIKQKYLPDFAAGKVTGAMVLTEPDAGSDLQAVKLRAFQDNNGNWFLHGVKRFITNGCGDVLLVLARSEPERSGGLGLSLFVCGRGATVHIRRLEDKLGIHGSPTCEIFFDNTPCQLIGERQRGLVTYVMALMNGARIGIAAQSVGIAEAAYRVGRDYAASRKQFGVAIEKLPAVADMLIDMKVAIEAGRALLYETSCAVDMVVGYNKQLEQNRPEDKDQARQLKKLTRKYKRHASMLTPMSKYYCSEKISRQNRASSHKPRRRGPQTRNNAFGEPRTNIERHIADALTGLYNSSSVRVNELGFDSWAEQVVHGDWHQGNMLFSKNKLTAVLDFDSVKIAPPVTDLANGMLQFSIVGDRPNPADWPGYLDQAKLVQFLDGYREVIKLDKHKLDSLLDLMIETMIAEAVLPVAATGFFGNLTGLDFLKMIQRKAEWLNKNRKKLTEAISS
ncbi:Crotonobetainyl-CoA reductase [subsurface metagenome]